MKACILATGPTLARLNAIPECDVSIAIKRAALRSSCDWVAILDSPALREYGHLCLGAPKLLTLRGHRPKYTQLPGIDVEDIPGANSQYTVLAAMSLAAHLGATHIDLYGVDWTNEPDFDGYRPAEMNRSEQRWMNEREAWEATTKNLAAKGVEVRRITQA